MGLVDRLYPQVGLAERVREFIDEIGRSKKRRYPVIALKGMNALLENNFLGRSIIFSKF